ncbi:MAG: hypothetical protein WB443_14285 [Nitrososphaeraceae archaeon]
MYAVLQIHKPFGLQIWMDGWMARRGQEDHNGWRSLLEGVMTILILILAKCIIKIVVPAFPLNRHQELICLLADHHLVVLYMLLATYRKWL